MCVCVCVCVCVCETESPKLALVVEVFLQKGFEFVFADARYLIPVVFCCIFIGLIILVSPQNMQNQASFAHISWYSFSTVIFFFSF